MKSLNQKGMIDGLLVGAIIISIVVGSFVLWQLQDSEDSSSEPVAETTTQVNTPIDETSQPADETEQVENIEEADLVAVNGFTASGNATRWTAGDIFYHEVIAQMDDPEEGKFYEGWIVGPSIVSTGMLVKEGEGEWSLSFQSEEDLINHDNVVITIETEANGLDGIPETHILEGAF